MNISLTINEDTLVPLLELISEWGPACPTQNENVRRLKVWRSLLSGLTPDQRAQLAANPQAMNAAFDYIPGPARGELGRSLDWSGIDPTSSKYQAENDVLATLLIEQGLWIDAGLIPGSTKSSSEWPAVALLSACHQVNLSPSNINATVDRAITGSAPSVLSATVPLVRPQHWEKILSKPIHGYEKNSPLFFYILPTDLALNLRPYLSAQFADLRTPDGHNGFFGRRIPEEHIHLWVESGMNPSARASDGSFPEELDAFTDPEIILPYFMELNKHRSPELTQLATWRYAVARLGHSNLSSPQERSLQRALRSPHPSDPQTGPDVISHAEQILTVAYENSLAAMGSNLFHILATQLPANSSRKWIDENGGASRVFGFFMGCSLATKSSISPELLIEEIQRYGVSNEEVLLGLFSTPANSNLLMTIPPTSKKDAHYTKMVREFIEQDCIEQPERWLLLLPQIQENFNDLLRHEPDIRLPILNIFAHILPRLPLQELLSGPCHDFLLAAATSFAIAEEGEEWSELDDYYQSYTPNPKFPIVDRTGLSEVIEQTLSVADLPNWWKRQTPRRINEIETRAPKLASQIKSSVLSDIAASASASSLRVSTPARDL